MKCKVSFEGESHPPVELAEHENLSEHLTVQNSPVLFGCRTGICGTCLIRVKGPLAPASEDERDLLDVVAPGDKQARLACQVDLTCDIEIAVP